jgi:hypothetical protein
MYGTSGEDAFEVELCWECGSCQHENEDITCWAEGSVANGICEDCGYEQEIDI